MVPGRANIPSKKHGKSRLFAGLGERPRAAGWLWYSAGDPTERELAWVFARFSVRDRREHVNRAASLVLGGYLLDLLLHEFLQVLPCLS